MLIVLLVCGCSDSDESDTSQTKEEDTISVSVKDLSGPVITTEKDTFELTVGDSFVLDDYIEVIDNVDGKLQYELKGSYDTKKVGTYEITIHAKDKSGNASNKKMTINVKEKEKEKPVESDTSTEQSNSSNNSSYQGSSDNSTQNQSGVKPNGKKFLLEDGYTMSGGSNAADDACLNYILQNVSPGWKGVCRTLTDANGVPTGSEAVWESY
ncbi:immunoglobulin-like domain-containing protein [Breznakia pachnodae]|uniref:Pesticidal crystal protein Cry22Aa Ig-like domain-containing protein n=1 Tax=Breznakia pachnodae TaxID=265178 RepID=A0ABU0E6M5_9FIRM|nr:immunoglobulin-like domain-containing protein [Breznakia pachnodae]MDQ0362542.1 hypothetical protein [Breznakia pachnodae]